MYYDEIYLIPIDPLYVLLVGGGILGIAGLIVLIIHLFTRNILLADGSRVRRASLKHVEAQPRIPFHGSIPAMARAATLLSLPALSMLTPGMAYLVKWYLAGDISYWQQELKKPVQKDLFKRIKQTHVMRLIQTPTQADELEFLLFSFLHEAAIGGNVLSDANFSKWIMENSDQLKIFNQELQTFGEMQLISWQFAAPDAKGKLRLTPQGLEELRTMLGLLRYVKELGKQNTVADQAYWREYLVFSTLFGLHAKAARGFQAADGAYFETLAPDSDVALLLQFMDFVSTWSPSAHRDGK